MWGPSNLTPCYLIRVKTSDTKTVRFSQINISNQIHFISSHPKVVSIPPSLRENREKLKSKRNRTVIGQVLLLLLCPGLLGNHSQLGHGVDKHRNECQTTRSGSMSCSWPYDLRAGVSACCSTKLTEEVDREHLLPSGPLPQFSVSPTLTKVPLTFAFNECRTGMSSPKQIKNTFKNSLLEKQRKHSDTQ